MFHDRYRVVIERKRPFRKPIDLPYGEMVRCTGCGHAAMVERGFGDGFTPHDGEAAYDALVRFFGRGHREVAMADAYRNARVDLMSNDSRWQMILNGFAHASYRQFVPPDGRAAAVPLVPEVLWTILVMFLMTIGWFAVSIPVMLVVPERFSDTAAVVFSTAMLTSLVMYPVWKIVFGLRSWSPDSVHRRSRARVEKALTPMLRGLDADGATLRHAKKAALENKWVSSGIDPERVLEALTTGRPVGARTAPVASGGEPESERASPSL